MIHISNAAVSIHRCRRRSEPVRSGASQFALRASAVVDYEAWTCRNRVITLKFIIWFHLKCFRRTKHGNDIWCRENVLTYTITIKFCVLFQENVLSYTKSSTRDNYGDRCIAPGLSITIFFLGADQSDLPQAIQQSSRQPSPQRALR